MSETSDVRLRARIGDHRHPPEPPTECGYVQDLAAPYALSAVEPHEAERISHHLDRCPQCARIIAEARRSIALLPFWAPLATPSLHAREALFARIAQVGQSTAPSFRQPVVATAEIAPTPTLPASRPIIDAAPGVERSVRRASPPSGDRRGFPSLPRPNWQLLATPLATVPLVVALAIVGGWALTTQARLNDRITQVEALTVQKNQLDDQVKTLNSSLSNTASNATVYYLTPQAGTGSVAAQPVGKVIANPGTSQATVMVWRMNVAKPQYDVVLETVGGHMLRAGVMPVNANGDGMTVLRLSQPISSFKSVHIKASSGGNGGDSSDSGAEPDILSMQIDPNLGAPADTGAAPSSP